MEHLLRGHATFRSEYAAHSGELLRRLAADHQSPAALYVGCSDSRVVPELLTSSSPGDLFVVRNVANAVPPLEHADASVGAALDYAVGILHVEHIIVCGHTRCGGVKAVLDGVGKLRSLVSLHEWLTGLAPAIEIGRLALLDPEEEWSHAVEVNVVQQLLNLTTYPEVRRRLDAGTLHLHGWVYDLPTGRLSVYDSLGERFVTAR